MAISIGVAIILVIYVLAMGATFYFCVIANPDTSPIARYISHTLPDKVMKLAGKVVGDKGVKVIETFMERLLAIIYLTVVIGSYSLIYFHGFPKARESPHIEEYHLNISMAVFFFALYTWRLTMTTSPGLITKSTHQFYDHFPYDDLLYVEGRIDKRKGVPRLPRSKYDRLKYHQHVPRFDHYCGWVATTVGEENYRMFLLFVAAQLAMCVYGTALLWRFFWGEISDKKLFEVSFFDRVSGAEYQADKWIVCQYLFHKHLYEAGMFVLVVVMSIALLFFLGYHCYITSIGMTTNEHFKWGEVRKWHKEQVRMYKEYQKTQQSSAPGGGDTGESKNKSSGKQKPPVPDGDVTCTGGKSAGEQPDGEAESEEVMEDPGPMPVNIYNRGFVENWKEVLFPRSLQRRAAASKVADKTKAT